MKNKYEDLYNELVLYGESIITSKEFALAWEQPHHFNTSLGEHILKVAYESLAICRSLEGHGILVNTQAVVRGALCHDLGMIGRTEKFANNRECCHQHPIDSVKIASRILPELDEKTQKIIRRHMWPLSLHPPGSREEWIVVLADKYVSMRELFERRRAFEGIFHRG
ncbi:MAG: HD domain-containing protein [Lachnospiraceae bacterium]|nr:HD domain-containing protein [Lachnospiraceae bacterium]